LAKARAVVVPDLRASGRSAPEDPTRRARIAAAIARFGEANVELPCGEVASETAARLARLDRGEIGEIEVVGGDHDSAAVAILIEALRERGLAARRFESAHESPPEPAADLPEARDPRLAAEERAVELLRALWVEPLIAIYAGRGLRERNADSLVNLR
jgi:hypothetical protein